MAAKSKKTTLTVNDCKKISDSFYKRQGIKIPPKDMKRIIESNKPLLKEILKYYKKIDGHFDTADRESLYYTIAYNIAETDWPCNGDDFETSAAFEMLMAYNANKRGYELAKNWKETLDWVKDLVSQYHIYASDDKPEDEIVYGLAELLNRKREYQKLFCFEQVRQGLVTDKQLKKLDGGIVPHEKLERK